GTVFRAVCRPPPRERTLVSAGDARSIGRLRPAVAWAWVPRRPTSCDRIAGTGRPRECCGPRRAPARAAGVKSPSPPPELPGRPAGLETVRVVAAVAVQLENGVGRPDGTQSSRQTPQGESARNPPALGQDRPRSQIVFTTFGADDALLLSGGPRRP